MAMVNLTVFSLARNRFAAMAWGEVVTNLFRVGTPAGIITKMIKALEKHQSHH